jgi:RecB family endonuclease NucS
MTAAELTRHAKELLERQGYRLNRVNNIPVRRRKGTVQKGWPDLQGYTKDGLYAAVEVKTKSDRLSVEQIDRLKDALNCGAKVYICTIDENEEPLLIEFGKSPF